MKIIYYCDWFKEYTANLALAVASEAIEVTLIMRESSREFDRRRADEERLHRELMASGVELHLIRGKYSSLASVVSLRRMYRGKRKVGYDRFHLQQTGDPRFLWLALRMPTVLTLHEPTSRAGVVSGVDRLRDLTSGAVQHFYRRLADLIVVHTTGSLSRLTPSERLKAVVIPHGVDPLPVNSSPDSKTILFFGRAAAYKGIDTLLAAMAKVWAAEPDARLRILASPGDVAAIPVADPRIDASWDGYSNEQLELEIGGARVVCLPYTSASGSGVAAQAYGSGRPIVASDLEGLRELVAHKELLANPADETDLARALITALRQDYVPRDIDPMRAWPGVAAQHIRAYRSLAWAHDRSGSA